MAHYPWEKSYPPSVRWELEIPKKTIHQIFEESCAQYGDRPFTDFLDKVMTFRDYKEASDKAAAGFQKLGVKPGVNVGLYLPNTPHYVIAFFGVLKAGGAVVNYSPLDAERVLEHKVEDSRTDILVTLDLAALYPQMERLLGKTRLKTLVVGEIAEFSPAPDPVREQLRKANQLSSVIWSERIVPFKSLLEGDARPTAHPFGDPAETIAVLQYTG